MHRSGQMRPEVRDPNDDSAPDQEMGSRSGRWWRAASRFEAHRPPWWPETEEWPPRDHRHWRRARRHNPFLRRLGCLWVFANLLGLSLLIWIVGTALHALTVGRGPSSVFTALAPGSGILAALALIAVVLGGISLRRVSGPLDALLDASRHIADGDLSARVQEKGPAEVRSLTAAFNSMAARLQAQDEQRRGWLADVTHELRTPLTILQGNLEGIVDGIYDPDAPRLRSLLEEVQVLSRLTDDLRILALAEAGNLDLRREPTEVAGLVREVATAAQARADMAGVRIELKIGPDLGTAEIDAERIQQVLNNLLFNSIRYTPAGKSVMIRVQKSAEGKETNLTIAVEDQGPGIASEDLPHIFERFYKSADSRGMGLGLAIAKHIVEAHGGRISVANVPSGGTRTTFSLPA